MNEENAKISPHYVLVIDNKRNVIMSTLFQVAKDNSTVFAFILRQYGITTEEFASFIK